MSDDEHKRFFMQLLEGVIDESWNWERIKAFLDENNIAESDLVRWLRVVGKYIYNLVTNIST